MFKQFILLIIGIIYAVSLSAEVTFDGSLGSQLSLEGPQYEISAELGQQQGNNLFHSFEKFNLSEQESANFYGPEQISNIISRVTGGEYSHIDGTIYSDIPQASFYFINPEGILFGANASIDVDGDVYLSSANTLRFADGAEFNAENIDQTILSVAEPSAFGFLGDTPSPVRFDGSQLGVYPGNTLAVVGGNITLDQTTLGAESGKVILASVAGKGDVIFSPKDVQIDAAKGDINAQNQSRISASGQEGGKIYIRAGQFTLENTLVDVDTAIATGKGIDVHVDSLDMKTGGRIMSRTFGEGRGGDISITVANQANIEGTNAGIFVNARVEGDSGNIHLQADTLQVKNGARINADARGAGRGGNISLNVNNDMFLGGENEKGANSFISSSARGNEENAGAGGDMDIQAGQLTIADGAQIGSVTIGIGNSGTTHIKVKNQLVLRGETQAGVSSGLSSNSVGRGDAGRIIVETNDITLQDGTSVSVAAAKTGRGGNIQITANNLKLTGENSRGKGSLISASTHDNAVDAGQGGEIILQTTNITLENGGQIVGATFGAGQGGTTSIQANGQLAIKGQDSSGSRSGVYTSSLSDATNAGNAGGVSIQATQLNLDEQARISADSRGAGMGGNIVVQANQMLLKGQSKIVADSEGTGNAGRIALYVNESLTLQDSQVLTSAQFADGGNMELHSPGYIYLINSQLSTSVNEEFGGGGNISLNPEFIVLDGSQIFAKAKKGAGGNIEITTTGIYSFTQTSIGEVINASSEFGVDGEVTIQTPDESADEGLLSLSAEFLDASRLLQGLCDIGIDSTNHFVVVNYAGNTSVPDDLRTSEPVVLAQVQSAINTVQNRKQATATKFANRAGQLYQRVAQCKKTQVKS